MVAALRTVDAFLRRGEQAAAVPQAARPARLLLAIIVAFGPLYGAAMGTFGFDFPERFLQMTYSAVKVPLLLLVTSALCLPAFVVLNTLLGLRDDLRAAVQALLAGQAALSVALASLSPFVLVWYMSAADYGTGILFNGFLFLIAAIAGQVAIRRSYRPLIARNPRHRIMLWAWLLLYAFVGIQMGWTLRPFVGSPGMAVTFFRQEPFTNAYVVVLDLLLRH